MSTRGLLWLSMMTMLAGCSSSGGTETGTGGAPGTGGALGTGGSAAKGGASGTGGSATGGGSGGSAPGRGGSGGAAPGTGGGSGGTGAAGGAAGSAGGLGGSGVAGGAGSGQAGATGKGGAAGSVTGGGGAPHVTPQNSTSVPAMYGNTVANGGKLTAKMYPTYYYSPSASGSPTDAFKTTPRQSTPVMKPCNVYTPPRYDQQMQYPLIVIMHGYTDNQNTWNERSNPNVVKLFDNLITSKVTAPFIAVFAVGTANATGTTGGYYLFGDELMNDLLPFMEANYSVKKDRGSRAMAGFSFGGMQTLLIGVCAHLKDFAWFAALDPAGPGTPSADDIAKYVAMENPQMYPLYYLHISVGKGDTTASGSAANAANGLTSKGPYITSANFSFQNQIGGQSVPDGYHDYPTAEVGLYNLLRMAFAPTN